MQVGVLGCGLRLSEASLSSAQNSETSICIVVIVRGRPNARRGFFDMITLKAGSSKHGPQSSSQGYMLQVSLQESTSLRRKAFRVIAATLSQREW